MGSSSCDFPLGTGQPHTTRHEAQAPGRESAGRGEDTAETSGMGQPKPSLRDRHVQRARRTVEETPEVREERVAAAKRALRAGTLKLRGEELVEKLLCDPLHHPDLGVEP